MQETECVASPQVDRPGEEAGQAESRRELLGAAAAGIAGAAALLAGASEAQAANRGAPRWAMIIDLRRCIGCRGCTIACKAEQKAPLGVFSAAVEQEMVGKYPKAKKVFLPLLCNHCKGKKGLFGQSPPPCVDKCPERNAGRRRRLKTPDGKRHKYRTGATYQRHDGAILFDNKLCTGCGKCIEACPYKVRWFDPNVVAGKDSTKKGIGKCTFCMHRVEKGLLPACVSVCEGKARTFGDMNDPASPVSKLAKEFSGKLVLLLPDEETDPHVYYIDPDGIIAQTYKKPAKGDKLHDSVY